MQDFWRCFRTYGLSLWAHRDESGVGMRSDDGGEAEEAGEGGLGRAAAVEAEGELVEVGVEVLRPQAVVDAQRPPLGVGEDAVDPGQHEVGRRLADPLRIVLDLLEAAVAGPAVTDDR